MRIFALCLFLLLAAFPAFAEPDDPCLTVGDKTALEGFYMIGGIPRTQDAAFKVSPLGTAEFEVDAQTCTLHVRRCVGDNVETGIAWKSGVDGEGIPLWDIALTTNSGEKRLYRVAEAPGMQPNVLLYGETATDFEIWYGDAANSEAACP